MKSSDSIKTLAPALKKAWANIGSAKKDGVNPHFKSAYSTLTEVIEVVKGPLLDQGISILQPTGQGFVETVLLHESGEWISGETAILCSKPNDPQAQGSAITYAKRYGLQAMCAVPSEDDDGEGAMSRQKQAQKPDGPKYDPNDTLQAEAARSKTW